MPAKDKIHDQVKNALVKDGWTITDDPLYLHNDDFRAFVDLGAERVIAAQRDKEKIAVEIKSFVGYSVISDLEQALGQYGLYTVFLEQIEPSRKLYLAISEEAFVEIFETRTGKAIIQKYGLKLVAIDIHTEEVIQWLG